MVEWMEYSTSYVFTLFWHCGIYKFSYFTYTGSQWISDNEEPLEAMCPEGFSRPLKKMINCAMQSPDFKHRDMPMLQNGLTNFTGSQIWQNVKSSIGANPINNKKQ